MTDADLLDEENYDERRQRLIESAREERQRHEAQQEAMLEAVAEGENFDIESHTWVSLGEADLHVKEWFPGDTVDQLAQADMDPNDATGADANRAIGGVLEAFVTMTDAIEAGDQRVESKPQIRSFWRSYFERWGDQGLAEAFDVVLTPAIENSEGEEAVESFRSAGGGRGVRSGPRSNR